MKGALLRGARGSAWALRRGAVVVMKSGRGGHIGGAAEDAEDAVTFFVVIDDFCVLWFWILRVPTCAWYALYVEGLMLR